MIVDPESIRRLADMHAVYRMFDQKGRLLYIGISGRAGRFNEHATKRWFPLVSVITLEWHATHAEAILAERRAISAEKPRYNVTGNPASPKRSAQATPQVRVPPAMAVLSDVFAAFEEDGAKGLHWQVIAKRLARRSPERWEDISSDAISAHCRSLGVPSVAVKVNGSVLRGCRRGDIEAAMAQQILKDAG
jgi:hypothetical protein